MKAAWEKHKLSGIPASSGWSLGSYWLSRTMRSWCCTNLAAVHLSFKMVSSSPTSLNAFFLLDEFSANFTIIIQGWHRFVKVNSKEKSKSDAAREGAWSTIMPGKHHSDDAGWWCLSNPRLTQEPESMTPKERRFRWAPWFQVARPGWLSHTW